MLSFQKGTYFGAVSSITPADSVLIGVTEYRNDQAISPMHYHENAHLTFILKGSLLVDRKNSGLGKVIEPFGYMRAGEVHATYVEGDYCKSMNLELEKSFFSNYGICESDLALLITNQMGFHLLMTRLYKELTIKDDNFQDSVHMLLLNAVCNLRTATEHGDPSWVKIVRELLHDQWSETVTLKEISLAANVHPVTISKYFSKYFSTSFGEYRRKLKVEKAISLICSTNKSLTEISYECGFSDQSHFIKSFKELTLLLPKDFRKA